MFYALNLFDLEDADLYRSYMKIAGPIVKELGGDLVVMGRLTDQHPMIMPESTIGGGQRWCVIATYQTKEDVIKFWEHPDNVDFRHLRHESTSNYVWAMYEQANVMENS